MSIFAYEINGTQTHPNADSLRVYRCASPGQPELVVIANVEHVYAVGDIVAIAQVGTQLPEGTVIRRARLRGVDSFGMILGRCEGPLGQNLDGVYGVHAIRPEAHAKPRPACVKWGSIELLHNLKRKLDARSEALGPGLPKIDYRAKIKLDGTNAGLQIDAEGRVFAQSRTRVLDVADDNYGFAAWVAEQPQFMAQLSTRLQRDFGPCVVFGEWCGPGIQKRTALAQLDRKIFAVYALQVGDGQSRAYRVIVEPQRLRALLPAHDDVFVLPWACDVIRFDFSDRQALQRAADEVNTLVAEVEACDPWVEAEFGIRGLGEGVVLYPVDDSDARLAKAEDGSFERDNFSELLFKAKGEKHQVVRQKRAAQLAPEKVASISAFVDLTLPNTRLEQGLVTACGQPPEPRDIGPFLKWIALDIQKECGDELEASGLSWKEVASAISTRARAWLMQRASTSGGARRPDPSNFGRVRSPP